MYQDILSVYIKGLCSVKRGSTRFGMAPHKPILLLTFLEMADKGLLRENKVQVTADLVGLFQENWRLLVSTSHTADFTKPFYYLQNDRINRNLFWFLIPRRGMSIHGHIKSIHTLISHLDYGRFEDNLFSMINERSTNSMLRLALLEKFFPEKVSQYLGKKSLAQGYFKELEDYILHEAADPFKTLIVREEEEVYVRQGFFKKHVPQVYNDTCCISGMRLIPTHGYSMVDACHIVPFAVSQDDRISNGLALCPNMHRAFDRGLLAINSDYTIQVSDYIYEAADHPYSLGRFKGRKIRLPENSSYLPSQANFEWHLKNVFKS